MCAVPSVLLCITAPVSLGASVVLRVDAFGHAKLRHATRKSSGRFDISCFRVFVAWLVTGAGEWTYGCATISRSRNRWILPVGVFGSSDTNSIQRGRL